MCFAAIVSIFLEVHVAQDDKSLFYLVESFGAEPLLATRVPTRIRRNDEREREREREREETRLARVQKKREGARERERERERREGKSEKENVTSSV